MTRRLATAIVGALLISMMAPGPLAVGPAAAQGDEEQEYRPSSELRLELFRLFEPDGDPDRDTRNVPDADFPTSSSSGETLRAQAVLRHSAAPGLEVTVDVEHNADTGYTRASTNARDLAELFELENRDVDDAPAIDDPQEQEPVTDPSLVFEAVDHGGTHTWARGLPVEGFEGDEAPSPTRWYSYRTGPTLIAVETALSSVDQLWAEGLKRMPAFDESTNEDGTVMRRAVGGAGTDVSRVFGALSFYRRDDAERVVVTTGSTAVGILESATLEVDFHNGDNMRLSIRFFDRGLPIEPVEIGDVYRLPSEDVGNDIPADDYDWSATGASFGPDGVSTGGPWTVNGQVRRRDTRRTSLSITAGDLAILTGRESIAVPDDHEIVRYEYDRRSYIAGLTVDFGPRFPPSEIDPEALYIYDLLPVPTRLFPMGLSDEQVWVRLGTVPELTTLAGWVNDRVTTSRIPLRVVGYDGFLEWVESESPEEIFTVTVGSNDGGRVERVLVETLDPDGSGLAFDITVHAHADEPVDLPAITATHLRNSTPPLTLDEEALHAFEGARFEEFFEDNRREYPTVTSERLPRYLTVIAEPAGPPKTRGLQVTTWPNSEGLATGAWSVPGTDLIVGCLSTTDLVGRAELTHIWDTFEDGSSLDARLVQLGPDRYRRVTLYATDEYTSRGPCWWEPLPFN